MQLPQQASDGIWKITRASELVDNLQPLLSNAESNRSDLTVERYKTGRRLVTPPAYFENQHLVGIQWTGTLEENHGALRLSIPNGTSIFPVGLPLEEQTLSEVEFTNLSLNPLFLRRLALESELYDRFELVPQWAIRDEQIESLAFSAECEIRAGLLAGKLFMDSLATALAAHLLTRYSSRPVALRRYRGGMSTYQLRHTMDLIEAHLGDDLGLAELAANVQLSPYYFCRLFKQSTGLSPHQFVMRKRIEQAQHRLKEHRLTIAEIADELGFGDQSHFTRVFRQVVGTSPKRFSLVIH